MILFTVLAIGLHVVMSVYMLLFLQNQSSDHHFTQNPFMIVYLIKDMFDVFPSDHVAWVRGYEESQRELLVLCFAYVVWRNKLAKAVSNMCNECGIHGVQTKHSLRATAATRLYA